MADAVTTPSPEVCVMAVPGESREHVVDVYRHRARRYDLALEPFSLLGYRWRRYRRQAVEALGVQRGDTVVEIGCGTGLNFELIEHAIGPDGRLVGVDLTDAMLAQASHRVRTAGWSNVTLIHADAVDVEFPTGLNAIISTYALSLVPESAQVIARGCVALPPGGRWVVLDVKIPTNAPRWVQELGLAAARPFACTREWTARRDWEAVRAAMQDKLTDISWTEMFFGFTYLVVGTRSPGAGGAAGLMPHSARSPWRGWGLRTRDSAVAPDAGGPSSPDHRRRLTQREAFHGAR